MQTDRPANESGTIWIEKGAIHYDSTSCGKWTCRIADLVLVGEYTNDHGPYLDDWFLVFMLQDLTWFEASMYARESEMFRDGLKSEHGIDIETGLVSSTDFKSRVMWPEALRDTPLFDFKKVGAKGIVRRIKLAIVPEFQFCLSAKVEEFLKGVSNQALLDTSLRSDPEG